MPASFCQKKTSSTRSKRKVSDLISPAEISSQLREACAARRHIITRRESRLGRIQSCGPRPSDRGVCGLARIPSCWPRAFSGRYGLSLVKRTTTGIAWIACREPRTGSGGKRSGRCSVCLAGLVATRQIRSWTICGSATSAKLGCFRRNVWLQLDRMGDFCSLGSFLSRRSLMVCLGNSRRLKVGLGS